MHKLFVSLILMASIPTVKGQSELFTAKADSSGYTLTAKGASHLASLPLRCILQEFPNKTNHTSNNDSDHVLLPKQLHPAFYGCFDWHSSVHGHWMLIRLLKLFPDLPEAADIRNTLNRTITTENINSEVKYFSLPFTASWERTYGWAWILKLDEELYTWNDPDGKKWHEAMHPLTQKIEENMIGGSVQAERQLRAATQPVCFGGCHDLSGKMAKKLCQLVVFQVAQYFSKRGR